MKKLMVIILGVFGSFALTIVSAKILFCFASNDAALRFAIRYISSPLIALAIGALSLPAGMARKWLWAARFFKTRSLAAKACELGRVHSNGQLVKPARDVKVGDMLSVKNESGEFEVEVLALSEMRGPAPVARTLYRETEASRELRLKLAEERKAMPRVETSRAGKPSKRDRREIDRLRGRP